MPAPSSAQSSAASSTSEASNGPSSWPKRSGISRAHRSARSRTRGKGVARKNRSPQAPQQRGGDGYGFVAVQVLLQRRAGLQPLEQQRAKVGLGVQEADSAIAFPQREGVGLGARLLVDQADLEDDLGAVTALGRRDEADDPSLEGPPEVHANHLVRDVEVARRRYHSSLGTSRMCCANIQRWPSRSSAR